MNLVDLLFLGFVAFYAVRGYHRGFIREGLDLTGFVLGAFVALRLHRFVALPLVWLGMNQGWASLLAGLLIFGVFIFGSGWIANKLHKRAGKRAESKPFRVGGAVFAGAWSAMFVAFMMALVTVVPSPRTAQTAVRDSLLRRTVLSGSSPFYPVLADVARQEGRSVLFYLRQYFTELGSEDKMTDSDEFFTLQPSEDIALDFAAEKEIFELVNSERKAAGLGPVRLHVQIREVARKHSRDMYVRGYFAHRTPDGKDPFERIHDGEVMFIYAGENLALAPKVAMVHQGLMNSPKHKENILKPEFTDLGVGVFKGPYGLMVTQNFCSGCRK
ncbi:MAG TPA: CvpA family protein [Actinomycetota bacterium]|nr:CvpA family protein [Actinomycetota bacterium]